MELLPATALSPSDLVDLINAGYADYLVPMTMDESGLRDHVEINGIDLDCSRVAVEEAAVAFALVARRGAAGWVGGMGTVPSRRERGLGKQVLLAGIDAARARGCRTLWLEVIDRNLPAIGLYRRLGFEHVRDLLVWSLAPTRAASPASRTVAPDVAHAWIAGHRRSREPWQRADETITSIRARGSAVSGLLVERAGEVRAAALVAERDDHVNALQVAGLDADAAGSALLAATRGRRSVRLVNAPGDEPASGAMRQLGARLVVRQHEMRLRL